MRLRVCAALVLVAVPAMASGQLINRERLRYDRTMAQCVARFEQQVEAPRRLCAGACLTAATTLRNNCTAAAESRYRAALRRQLQPRY